MRSKGVFLGLALGVATLAGCLSPPSQASRVTDAARELNLATRFGRMDIALTHTANGAREAFLDRRGQWGKHLRIVDVELAGLTMKDEHEAMVQVDVSWVRVEDENLRVTRVAQKWRDDDGWQLIREQRLAGDLGLFGEPVVMTPREPRDVQFPSRTIR